MYNCTYEQLLSYVGMSESTFYYKPSGGKKGLKPTEITPHKEKGNVTEDELIKEIKEILSHEFIDCGYRIMTKYLQRKGFRVNHKKVYRIMGNAGLLKLSNQIKRSGSGRKFVRFRKVKTTRPFECLEMDIKMVWIPNVGKNAYLLSVIDVHTRKILTDLFSYSVKKKQVINLLSNLFSDLDYPESVVIRSDNGSQFIARDVREFLGLIGVDQEFTHVATPEENAHIEAYHGTLKRDIFDRIEYRSFGEIESILKRYVLFYNNVRLHGLLGRITPMEKWTQDLHLIKRRKWLA